jgi:hypothetical protein
LSGKTSGWFLDGAANHRCAILQFPDNIALL